MDVQSEAIAILIGVEISQLKLIGKYKKVGLDINGLVCEASRDNEGKYITDAIGNLLGMDGESVNDLIQLCYRKNITSSPDILDLLKRSTRTFSIHRKR